MRDGFEVKQLYTGGCEGDSSEEIETRNKISFNISDFLKRVTVFCHFLKCLNKRTYQTVMCYFYTFNVLQRKKINRFLLTVALLPDSRQYAYLKIRRNLQLPLIIGKHTNTIATDLL